MSDNDYSTHPLFVGLGEVRKWDDSVIEGKLQEIIDAPMDGYADYSLVFYGVGHLAHYAGIASDDDRIRRTVYERCIKMLEFAENQPFSLVDFVVSGISRCRDPDIPDDYKTRLQEAANDFCERMRNGHLEEVEIVRGWASHDFHKVYRTPEDKE